MNARAVCVESANLRLVATVDGRARYPVFLFDLAAADRLLATETLNVASSKDRAKFLGLLRDTRPELDTLVEVPALLERLAAETAAAVLTSDAPGSGPNLDVEPWGDAVDGGALLDSLSALIRQYIHLPSEAADAIAVWAVLTHCVEWLMFAPLLVLSSASKRCGKTALLALITPVVRRGRLTSATGITPAVLFRLNERDRPTLCLDEAEKLQGRHADPNLLGLINDGYRRGGKVYRCVERVGSFDIQEFDAFGFRALALIGKAWDTVADRSVLISMERKPRTVRLARFHEAVVERIGSDIARRARRWTTDEKDALRIAYDAATRPTWLGDRDCDNWAGLFAVANVAGGRWPERIEAAARLLAGSRDEDGDAGERMIHDMRGAFASACEPPVIPSGELVQKLNAIETSAWGDLRDGRGLSTHALAARLRPFGVKPRAERHPATGAMVRGYWLADLRGVFERYPAPEADAGNAATIETLGAGKRPPTTSQAAEPGEPRPANQELRGSGDSRDDEGVPREPHAGLRSLLPAPTVSSVSVLQDAEYERDERAGMANP